MQVSMVRVHGPDPYFQSKDGTYWMKFNSGLFCYFIYWVKANGRTLITNYHTEQITNNCCGI